MVFNDVVCSKKKKKRSEMCSLLSTKSSISKSIGGSHIGTSRNQQLPITNDLLENAKYTLKIYLPKEFLLIKV